MASPPLHYTNPLGSVPRVAPATDILFSPVTEGPQVGPITNTLLCDTGPLPVGIYEFRLFLGAGAETVVNMEQRNAANDANIGGIITLFVPAAVTAEYVVSYDMTANQRLRLVMADNFGGTISAAIQGRRLTA